jgi:hypothetical protein
VIRIEQEMDFALSLQRRVMAGDVVPAPFQRPYVWTEEDVENLWQSIEMGLPIGSVLLWRPPGEITGSRLLGPIRLEPSYRSALVIDGQNRLATLAWSATAHDEVVDEASSGLSVWRSGRRLVADALTSRVRFAGPEEVDPWLVPMHVIGGSLQMHLRTIWDGSEEMLPRVTWLEDIEHRLRTARMVITTITADEREARIAYLRMASAGRPMSPEDLDAAITGAAIHA